MTSSLLLLLATAASPTVVDAERAFAAKAQVEGQWTAFRAYAAPTAIMFVPEAVNAQEWLQGRADPPVSVMWWPAKAFVSCDGAVAVTTGPWVRSGGRSFGYFTTIWARHADGGWKWVADHGEALAHPRPAGERPVVRRAACSAPATVLFRPANPWAHLTDGRSADHSLVYQFWTKANGERRVVAAIWTGQRFETVIDDRVPAAPR